MEMVAVYYSGRRRKPRTRLVGERTQKGYGPTKPVTVCITGVAVLSSLLLPALARAQAQQLCLGELATMMDIRARRVGRDTEKRCDLR
jgi:hypothetical protein